MRVHKHNLSRSNCNLQGRAICVDLRQWSLVMLKGNVSASEQAVKGKWGERKIDQRILNFNTTWGWRSGSRSDRFALVNNPAVDMNTRLGGPCNLKVFGERKSPFCLGNWITFRGCVTKLTEICRHRIAWNIFGNDKSRMTERINEIRDENGRLHTFGL
jgi:hypothetical protein